MEQELVNILDNVYENMRAEFPKISAEHAALRTVRLNLHVLTETLIMFGMTGMDLPNALLASLTGDLLDSLEWIVVHDDGIDVIREFEELLSDDPSSQEGGTQ